MVEEKNILFSSFLFHSGWNVYCT